MNPANNNPQNKPVNKPSNSDTSAQITATPAGKEAESITASSEKISEIKSEIDITPEVAKAGVKKINVESIELPPDVIKLGVTSSGVSQPVVSTINQPSVNLPISDDKVISGLSAQVTTALRWLSVWCIKKLQKAHLRLRVIHGKIIRVNN